MNFHIDVEQFLMTLPMMAKGMLSIFVVAGVLILSIWLLNKASNMGKKAK